MSTERVVKRWVSPYAAGTESYRMFGLKDAGDRAEPDHDEGPFFVLASDHESEVSRLKSALAEAERQLAIARPHMDLAFARNPESFGSVRYVCTGCGTESTHQYAACKCFVPDSAMRSMR